MRTYFFIVCSVFPFQVNASKKCCLEKFNQCVKRHTSLKDGQIIVENQQSLLLFVPESIAKKLENLQDEGPKNFESTLEKNDQVIIRDQQSKKSVARYDLDNASCSAALKKCLDKN